MTQIASLLPLASPSHTALDPQVQKAARDFEASFLTPMVDEALRTAGEATFGGGQAETVWRSFLAGAIAEQIADGQSTGIAQTVAAQMAAYRE